MMSFRFFVFVILLIEFCKAISFTGSVTVSNDPLVTGILTGSMQYNWNSANQYDTANSYQLGYSGIPEYGGTTVYEVLQTVTASGSTQYQNVKYLICGSSCDASTYTLNFPNFHWSSAGMAYVGQDSYGFRFTRSGATTDITNVWYSTQTPSSFATLKRAQFGSGKTYEFNIVSTSTGAFASTTTCPTSSCTVVADIVQVIDDSGSIGTTNFRNAVMPFAVNICNSYDWAVSGKAGITMAGVFFSTTARTILAWTNSKASAVGAFNNGLSYYTGGNTCITCGINQAVTLFNARLSGRSSVSKLVFFMTDGYANVGGSLYTAADASKAQNITTVAIGVGSAVSESQLNYIASTIPGVQTVFQVSDFNSLVNIRNSLVGVTCTTLQGSPCGNGCQGFCGCGAICVCPQCDASNLCLIGTCTAGQYSNACTYQAKVCNDNNACTLDTCNATVGCQFLNISSSCNSADNCKITSCNNATGCVSQDRICTSADPCQAASCSPSTPGGCVLTNQTCDTCKIPIAGGRSAFNRPCPDPDSILDEEKPDGNSCKDWYCDPNDFYVTTQYPAATPTPVNIGRCKYTERTCLNNNCTNNTCVPATGLCYNNFSISSRCDDGNPCTRDSCNATGGCITIPFVESDCYYLTGGLKSQCFRYVLNSTDPVCCQVVDISEPLCKANYSDKCLDWQCVDFGPNAGCNYFTKDCEREFGVEKITDCYTATCTNETGCLLSLIDGKKVDTKEGCELCVGTAAYNASDACTAALTVSDIGAIPLGILAIVVGLLGIVCIVTCGAIVIRCYMIRKSRNNALLQELEAENAHELAEINEKASDQNLSSNNQSKSEELKQKGNSSNTESPKPTILPDPNTGIVQQPNNEPEQMNFESNKINFEIDQTIETNSDVSELRKVHITTKAILQTQIQDEKDKHKILEQQLAKERALTNELNNQLKQLQDEGEFLSASNTTDTTTNENDKTITSNEILPSALQGNESEKNEIRLTSENDIPI